jgi:hypothetical protein
MMVRDETAKTPSETGMRRHEMAEAYLKQYVEATKDEPAHWPREAGGQGGLSGVSAVAVEALMNNVG